MNNYKILEKIEYSDSCNGYYSIKTKYGKLITNKQGVFILDAINQDVPLDQIISEFSLRFNETKYVSEEWINSFLYELQLNDMVSIDACFFDSYFSHNEIAVAGEKEYAYISQIIIENLHTSNTLFSFSMDKHMYHKYNIRAKGFNNRENYFYDADLTGIKNIVGLQNLSIEKQPIVINLIQSFQSVECFKIFFDKLICYLIQKGKKKIKIVICTADLTEELRLFLDMFSFEQEGLLRQEDGLRDYLIYSKFIGIINE